MRTQDLSGATVLVTGAGSGIGRETALECARRGARLVVCDLNQERLAATEKRIGELGREALACAVDVASADDMRAFAERVHGEVEAVDLLINNAGVGLGAGFLDTSLDDWTWLLGIDLLGVVHGCHFFVPAMVRRARGGHVVNVSSAAGYVASSALCAYSTAKFGVLGLSEALREELAPHGIGVTAVCPGLINTAIVNESPLRGAGDLGEARRQIQELYRRRDYTPERVARNLLRAVQRNRAVAPISPEAWALYYLKRLAPWLLARISRAIAARTAAASGAAPPP